MRRNSTYRGLMGRIAKENLEAKTEEQIKEEEAAAAAAASAPAGTPAEGEAPATEPAEGDTPADAPTDVPADTSSDTPLDVPAADPLETPSDTPSGEPTDAPIDTPVDAATDAPSTADADPFLPVDAAPGEGEPAQADPVDGTDTVDGAPAAAGDVPVDGAEPGEPAIDVAPVGEPASPEDTPDTSIPAEGTDAPLGEAPVDGITEPAEGEETIVPAETIAAPGEETPLATAEVADGDFPTAEVVPDATETFESDLLTVNGDVEELAAMDADIEDAGDVLVEMEIASEALEIIAGNGGLDRSGAWMMNLHLESLNKRVNWPTKHRTLATESFGGTADKRGTTVLAKENFDKSAKNLWEGILQMIEKAIAFIKEVFAKMFDGATKLKGRAEALIKQAAATRGEATAKSFKNDNLSRAIFMGGKVDAAKAAATLGDITKGLDKSVFDFQVTAANGMLAILDGGDLSALKQSVDVVIRFAHGEEVKDAAAVGIKEPSEGMRLLRGDELPGGRALIGVVPPAEGYTPSQAGEMRLKLGSFGSSAPAEGMDLAVLSPADAQAVAKHVLDIANTVISFKAKTSTMDQLKAKILASAKKQAAGQEATHNAMHANGVGGIAAQPQLSPADARALAKGAISMLDQPMAALLPYQLNTGKAFLDYVQYSLKAYPAPVAGGSAAVAKERVAPAPGAAPAKPAAPAKAA